MQNDQFKTPLLQSAAILIAVIMFFLAVGSSGTSSIGGVFLTLFSGIGNTILFAIGLIISLFISIAILIGIFLGAVAMVDSSQASSMYGSLKKNFTRSTLNLCGPCCETEASGSVISEKEYDHMKQEIAQLQEKNSQLKTTVGAIKGTNQELLGNYDKLTDENSNLKSKIEALTTSVESLQTSDAEIKTVLDDLKTKLKDGTDQELKDKINNLEKLQAGIQDEIAHLAARLTSLEVDSQNKPPVPPIPPTGIFTYIEEKEQQLLFINKVEEAIKEEMTYAQINDFLADTLPSKLNQVLKDHPTLTKNYIKEARKE